jgi:hypothetical protein
MLLHLIPRLYAFRSIEDECSLIDFECPTLGIFLRNGHEAGGKASVPQQELPGRLP